MALSIPSSGAVRDENGVAGWQKSVTDVNNIDELFRNARDVGYLRMNVSRLNVIGSLSAKYDASDLYKIQVQSNGKLKVAVRTGDAEDDEDKPVLDLSKYQEALDAAEQAIDPVGYAQKQAEKAEQEATQSLMETTAPGLRMQVYMKKGGREVLVADSHAEEGTKLREAADKMLTGEYKAKKGEYYVKIERDDTVELKKELNYVVQMHIGDSYKHDYTIKEQASTDTKSKKISTVPASILNGTISTANALQIQALRNESAANMLADGYLNLASIYNKKH